MAIDTGLVLYFALFVLFFWRGLCAWRCCGKWLQFANYCTMLYTVLFISVCYDIVTFVEVAVGASGNGVFALAEYFHHGNTAAVWTTMVPWMKPFIMVTPLVIFVTLACCVSQTVNHIDAIRKGEASLRHDRVVQIIALPVLYSVMAFSSGVEILQVASKGGSAVMNLEAETVQSDRLIASALTDPLHNDSRAAAETVLLALSKCETDYMVADLYEAWALYQFLKLTMELIASSILKQGRSHDIEERAAARTLTGVYSAVDSLAWLGPYLFLWICSTQAGWALYLLFFVDESTQWSDYESAMAQFRAAGFLASCAAIWNVAVVETSFHGHLHGYSPVLKFVTVKILVSFAFFQRGIIGGLLMLEKTMPSVLQTIVRKMPLLGDVVHMGTVEFELFYAGLIIFECLLITFMHWFAWDAHEEWYSMPDAGSHQESSGSNIAEAEKQPLLKLESNGQGLP